MKRIKKQLSIVLALALTIPIAVLAFSPPSIPLFVYGDVTIDDQPAPLDTEISAEIDNVEVAIAIMIREGVYFIEIPDGKVNEGKTIVFKVNGIADGNNQLLSVNIDTTPSINFDLAITTSSTPTNGGGGPPSGGGGLPSGGGGIPQAPSTTIQGDINGDDKVDKYDFALMMANWGKTGSNNSDLNNDNKVDKYDFALLMASWGTE